MVRIIFGRAAWTAARATMSRMPGLVAVEMASSMSAWSGLEDAAGLSGDTDADRGVAEDLTVLLRVPEQGSDRSSVTATPEGRPSPNLPNHLSSASE